MISSRRSAEPVGRRVAVLLASGILCGAACGQHQGPGQVTPEAVDERLLQQRAERHRHALAHRDGGQPTAQILFGDLHTHTTFSSDAFAVALPLLGGEGVHPPADACDFARFCADLDFWSINDHAEGITPAHWRETIDSVRACNAAAGDPERPDMVSFLGWEWTQVGNRPQNHYGHKNVVLREIDAGRVPARPIHAIRPEFSAMKLPWIAHLTPWFDFRNRQVYWDQREQLAEVAETPACPEGIHSRALPDDCMEGARTPRDLFRKLDEWGLDSLVIPHGTTWGFTSPPGSTLDLGLAPGQHDPQRERLFEVYSGHGNAEEFRSWTPVGAGLAGEAICPAPTQGYLPCCWQAGEIIRERCADVDADTCEARVEAARAHYLDAGPAGFRSVPGARVEDWLDCGQCRDCTLPANGHLPTMSAQYGLATSRLDEEDAPQEYRLGWIASSDTHRARPGNGFKEFGVYRNTDATRSPARRFGRETPAAESRAIRLSDLPLSQRRDTERQASLYLTGGLVAVHALGRDRDAIFDALHQRSAYATSGERILLWFDLLNGPMGNATMGAEVQMRGAPRFRVAAAGAFAQKPGCPTQTTRALGPERLRSLCLDECHHPGDLRRRITRIEVVRVRPRRDPAESIASLIDDPWRVFQCSAERDGCEVTFEDRDYPRMDRSVAYYVRAIQEATPAVNGAGLGCRYDEAGRCVEVTACASHAEDDASCLADVEERAWSSPIWLDPPPRS